MVIFGGEEEYKTKDQKRCCRNDTWYFDTVKMEWMDKTCGYRPSQRRNHSAVCIDKQMIVFGGISTYGVYLKDMWSFNILTLKWQPILMPKNTKKTKIKNMGLAFYSMCKIPKGVIAMSQADQWK